MPPLEDDIFADIQASIAELNNEPAATTTTTGGNDRQDTTASAPGGNDRQSAPTTTTTTGTRTRDESGRFAPADRNDRQAATTTATGSDDRQAATATGSDDRQDTTATTGAEASAPSAPPPGWSVKSKAEWEKLPQHIRDDVAKRELEVNNGFAVLREYKDLKPYADMAKNANTTLSKALENYVGIDNLLKSNPEAGFTRICHNLGMSQAQAGQFFAGLAQRFGGVAPAQNGQTDPLADVLNPFLQPLQRELTNLREQLSLREQANQTASQRALERAIETFSTDPANRYFPELAETISRLFETGLVQQTGDHLRDLRTAYDTAANMVPEVREALFNQRLEEQRNSEQAVIERAKAASRSVGGIRTPGVVASPQGVPSGKDDIFADVRAAYQGVMSS